MAERAVKSVGMGVKPVPMKLFATWEVEKTTPNCIPRLCSLTLTKLVVVKPLESDLQSLLIAVKMQNSKHVLRSNEIFLPANGLLDTELDLSFSLQYPHFLKTDVGNRLQVMLQRRKKYKNRTILGYKTLAIGHVNMAHVLQQSVDRELCLCSDTKERTNIVAKVMMLSLSSQPVDHIMEDGQQKQPNSETDRSPEGEMSDDDQDHDFGSSDADDMSDSEPIPNARARTRKAGRIQHSPSPFLSRQRNLKQRFVALLKRFKVTEEALDSEEQDQDLGEQPNPQEIEELFNELDDLSDSGPEMDNISVLSTPKPKLRPFFRGSNNDILEVPKDSVNFSDESSRRNDSDSHMENVSDPSDTPPRDPLHQTELSSRDEPKPYAIPSRGRQPVKEKGSPNKERKNSISKDFTERSAAAMALAGMNEPKTDLLDQLAAVLSTSDDQLPDHFVLVNTNEWQGQYVGLVMQEHNRCVLFTSTQADVKATVSYLVTRIQKFCNTNAKSPSPVKFVVLGADHYVNSVLCPYVEQFSSKSPDWQQYVIFYLIPTGPSCIARYLSNIDSLHSSLFMDYMWKEAFDKSDPQGVMDNSEIVSRVNKYLNSGMSIHNMPIGEAMITYKERGANVNEEGSSQIFVPFLSEVRIGPAESTLPPSQSVDTDESMSLSQISTGGPLSSSPPQSSQMDKANRESHTPPNSPSVASEGKSQPSSTSSTPVSFSEYVDLQIDYWTQSSQKPDTSDKGQSRRDNKVSIKSSFKSIQVSRFPYNGDGSTLLTVGLVSKEKKQKIMRIGKKSKSDVESKSQVIEGVTRLICTTRSQSNPLKLVIDGVEWAGVKFFQLSSQWQTHIKYFPVAVFNESMGEI